MLQGVIKSMPAYAQHHRCVMWPKDGRQFIVGDEKMLEESGKHARVLFDERRATDPENAVSPDQPVVYHVADPTEANPKRTVMKRGRIIDIPGKPVVMDEAAYDYIKEAFGSYLHCEPIGGPQDALAAQQKIATLETENAKMKARLADLEAKPTTAQAPAKK